MKVPKLCARSSKQRRGHAERLTLAVSVALVLLLGGSLALLHGGRGADRPPTIEVTPRFAAAEQRGDAWYLPVDVANVGDEPTDTVRVSLELVHDAGGAPAEESELEFQFLAGGETAHGVAVFDDEPTPDTVEADVLSYTDP